MPKNTADVMIYLIACALNGAVPDKAFTDEIDFDRLYRLANSHALTAAVCMALEKGNAFDTAPDETVKRWKEAKDKAIRKSMMLDSGRQKILDEMEKAGIWYLPLKGCVLKDLYPQYGMRQMADNDILYDSSRAKDLERIFKEQGYSCEEAKGGVHDIFKKPPVYNFEMHRSLFSESSQSVFAKKYAEVKRMLIPDEGRQYGYHLSDEDFYVYITAHAYKHFSVSGTGLRTMVDFYVFNREKGGKVDWNYIRAELDSLGIADYEEKSRRLAQKLFAEPKEDIRKELSEDEAEMLSYYLGSGTYGNITNHVKNSMSKMQGDDMPVGNATRLKYLMSRLFPGREWCREGYPFFYRFPVLLPLLWVYRIFRAVLFRRKRLSAEMAAVRRSRGEG